MEPGIKQAFGIDWKVVVLLITQKSKLQKERGELKFYQKKRQKQIDAGIEYINNRMDSLAKERAIQRHLKII